jgi:hypothetical protein
MESRSVELSTGRASFKVYRQFKMYNDPDTSPEWYDAASKAAAGGFL